MKQLFAFFAIFMGHYVLSDQGLRVRFALDSLDNVNKTFFFAMPTNVAAAKAEGWVETARPEGHLPELVMYCLPNDGAVCMMYDDTGYVAGLQIAISQDDFSDAVLNWSKLGYKNWTTVVNNRTKNFWTLQQYYVSEETLQKSKEERLERRDPNKTIQEDSIWLTGYNGEIFEVPLLIEQDRDYTNQACIDWMGDHYFNQLTPETECTSDELFPWFLLGHSGHITGVVYWTLGNLTIAANPRNWFENPASSTVRTTATNGPECLFSLAEDPGFLFMHIYFVDEPWLIYCS